MDADVGGGFSRFWLRWPLRTGSLTEGPIRAGCAPERIILVECEAAQICACALQVEAR